MSSRQFVTMNHIVGERKLQQVNDLSNLSEVDRLRLRIEANRNQVKAGSPEVARAAQTRLTMLEAELLELFGKQSLGAAIMEEHVAQMSEERFLAVLEAEKA